MDSASEVNYFEKLQQLVEDEDKIVTIPFLAHDLGIPVQDSERILKKYIEDRRNSDPEALRVTYILTGVPKDGEGRAVYMVEESDVPMKIELFEDVISEIVFSVQKTKNIDFNIIGLVDWADPTRNNEKPLLGTVVTKNYIKRDIKLKKLPAPPPPTIKGKSSFFAPKSENVEKKIETKVNGKTIDKEDKKPKVSGGIASMFGNMAASSSTKKSEPAKSTTSGKKGGLSNFLTKSSSKSLSNGTSGSYTSKENLVKSEDSTTSKEFKSDDSIERKLNDGNLSGLMEVDFDELDEVIDTTQLEVKKENGVKSNKEKKKRNSTKRSRDVSEEKSNKKRKRIIERNDSDSDDLFEREDITEKSEEEPERVPSPVTKLPPPRSKIRKAVDKTYIDEEGFVVTNQEYVFEVASEEENENPLPPPKVEEKPKAKTIMKKSSISSENDTSPQKGVKGKKSKKNNMQNQPTLMNFFTKK